VARTTEGDLAPHELRILVAVADAGGFSSAAQELGLTQSAVSHSVRGSEGKIGVVLFERELGPGPLRRGRRRWRTRVASCGCWTS
jgi:DNA-binding transcriptional LysR family regulator